MPGEFGRVGDGVGSGQSPCFDVFLAGTVASFTADAEFGPGIVL